MNTLLLNVLGFVLLFVGIAVSIALHECAHMVPAKRFGVRVPNFFIGFGKTLWSTRRGETEYGVKAFPLGGFVKLVGMIPPDPDPRPLEQRGRTGFLRQLVYDVRAAEQQLVQPGDEGRLFYQLPTVKKVVVMAGGPLVNVAIAFFLFAGMFAIQGVLQPTTTVAHVSKCVIAVKVDQKPRACRPGDPVAPAAQAGLRPGDRIVAANGTRIKDYTQLQKLIRGNGDRALALTVERAGKTLRLKTTTKVNELPSLDPGQTQKVVKGGFLGIGPTQVRVRKGPLYTAGQMVGFTTDTLKALARMPVKLVGVAKADLGLEKRAADSPMSVVGAGRVAGEITASHHLSVNEKLWAVIGLLAGINLFLGMFNFVPLPPLDGGHIAGALYEGARRTLARLFKRPDPGVFDVAKLLPVAYVMVGFFLVMTLLLVWADIFMPVHITG